MANVRTMDDLRREEAGRGVRPTPNPWAGGAAPAQGAPAPNFTPAGGYTPIPDQQSMGGVGAGDVYIDACGETIPVSSCCRQKSTSVKSFMIEGIVPFTLATSNGNVLPVLHRRPLFRKQAKLVCQSDENIHWNHFDNPNLHLHHRSFVEWLGWNSGRAERCALCHGWKGCVKYRSRRILAAHHADYAPCWNFPPCYQRLHSVYVRHPARKGMGRQSNCHYLCCRWSLWQRAVCSLCSVRSFYRLLRISFWSVWSAGDARKFSLHLLFYFPAVQVAYIVGMWRQLGDLQKKMLLLSLGLSFLFIFAFSFGVGVDMSAHLGGFLAGLVMGMGFFANKWDPNNWWAKAGPYVAFGTVAATMLIAVIFFWHNKELGYVEGS
mmetsp:Transcript_27483/g.72566  ORF Transcript_27483/g.72566 Transcript_27483/m.72566 type:complete len:378 (+) Transcript_27483:73-1206(+)